MKKQLLTTTALIVAGALAFSGAALAQKKASKPVLKLGGWFESILGVVDDNDDNSIPNHIAVDVQQDSEIFFKGSVTLDNGIKVRTRVELEAQSSNSSDQIDEAYMAISGGFGEIRIGSEDNAAHLLVTPVQGAWATNVGQNLNFDVQDWIDPPSGITGMGVNRLDLGDADSEKITYFTPRIEGFKFGVTYMPSFNEGQNGRPERTDNVHEGFAVAVRFDRKFDKLGIGAAVGYATADAASGADQSDPGGAAAGLKLTFGGFTAAVGYHNEWNLSAETATTDGGTEEWNFGVKYKQGKNNFSVGFAHAVAEGTRANTSEDKLDQLMVSYRRDLGPGVQYRLNFMWADWQGEDTGNADDNDGVAVTTSVRLAF